MAGTTAEPGSGVKHLDVLGGAVGEGWVMVLLQGRFKGYVEGSAWDTHEKPDML